MGKKFKMPSAKELFKIKKVCWRKATPIWIYLENEMVANKDKKPYNEKVGEWLKLLHDLRYHFHCEAKRIKRTLQREVGPAWYMELSFFQRDILNKMKDNIHQDLLEDIPRRTRKALTDLGITLKIPKSVLMRTMHSSYEDPGVFFWNLYKELYKSSPLDLKPSYDLNAMLLMSSLVFIDLDECIESLDQLVAMAPPPPEPPKKKKPKYHEPKIKLGVYLQKMHVPFYTNHPSEKQKQVKKQRETPQLAYKIRLRSQGSYENIAKTENFIEKRIDRNQKAKAAERVCNYKFWEPPSTLRNSDPKTVLYVLKLKMFKEKAKSRHNKHKAPFENIQLHIGCVSYVGEKPRYQLHNMVILPTGYIPLNGGVIKYGAEYITYIQGYSLYPRHTEDSCDESCDCVRKWEAKTIEYVGNSKCRCGHYYDYYQEGKPIETNFYKPTKYQPHFFNFARTYQMDPTEDFIIHTVKDALKSQEATPAASLPTLSAQGLKDSELLGAFMADVADTPLLIPHLPEANLLNNLQEWVRKRVKGKITPKMHKQWYHQSQRRWIQLRHIDFIARAYYIPFTHEQLHKMDWSHKKLVSKLCKQLLHNFQIRNKLKLLEETRLFWPTMKFDAYPSESFLETYFSYMPNRLQDIFLMNPYNPSLNARTQGKTCPLNL